MYVNVIDRQIAELEARKYARQNGYCYQGVITYPLNNIYTFPVYIDDLLEKGDKNETSR